MRRDGGVCAAGESGEVRDPREGKCGGTRMVGCGSNEGGVYQLRQ